MVIDQILDFLFKLLELGILFYTCKQNSKDKTTINLTVNITRIKKKKPYRRYKKR